MSAVLLPCLSGAALAHTTLCRGRQADARNEMKEDMEDVTEEDRSGREVSMFGSD